MRVLSTAELTAERLLIEAAQQDVRRFTDLYDRYFNAVYAFALVRTGNRSDAEDVTAETFVRAFRNLARFEWRGVPFGAWLYQIAAHAAADLHQRHGREVPLDHLVDGPVAMPDGELVVVEERADLFALVERLPGDQQQVILARFGEERSTREIALELGRSEGAVKQLQYRALKTLRAWVDSSHD